MNKLSKKSRFWIIYHAGLLVVSALLAMILKFTQTGDPFDPTVMVPFFAILIMSVLIGYLALFLKKRAENYSYQQLTKKIIPMLLVFYVGAFIIANLSVTIGVFGWYLYTRMSLNGFWSHMFRYELGFANRQLWLWLMFFTVAFFYILWQKSAKREKALQEEKLRFQYDNLKAQVNPHFLFNSLNTLSELVYQDPGLADQFISQLSGIYRYVLEHERDELVDLEQEIAFVKQYFSLQQVRDEGKIFLEIDVSQTVPCQIIPVSLQLLVENAVKHNACSQSSPLRIKIIGDAEYIIVSNNIQRKNILNNKTGTGLRNLKERTKLVMKKELVQLEQEGVFVIKVPVIRSKK